MVWHSSEMAINRKVRIYKDECNHMQDTPMIRQYHWIATIEPIGYFRSNSMLWGRATDDPYTRWMDKSELQSSNAHTLVHFCKTQGILII